MTSRALSVSYKSTNVRNNRRHGRWLSLLLALVGRMAPGLTGWFIKRSFFAPATPVLSNPAKLYNIVLHTTTGLGHKRILNDPGIMDLVQAYILERCGQGRHLQQAV